MINTSDTDLSAPATPALVDALYAAGHLDRESHDRAMAALYPPRHWGQWASRLLLAVGMVLVLTGIVFFFAHNWQDIPPLIKLGGIQVLITGFTLAAILLRTDTLPAQMMLLAASVMIGVFLAVFGQIYQTGADAWQLFAGWAGLALIWTLLSRFAPQWAVWLVIANIALVLWWQQNGGIALFIMPGVFAILMVFNLPVLLLFEALQNKPAPWRQKAWIRPVLVTGLTVIAVIPAIDSARSLARPGGGDIGTEGMAGVLLLIALYAWYRWARPSVPTLAPVLLGLMLIVISAVSSLLTRMLGFSIEFLNMAILAVLVIGLFVLGIRHLADLRTRSGDQGGQRS